MATKPEKSEQQELKDQQSEPSQPEATPTKSTKTSKKFGFHNYSRNELSDKAEFESIEAGIEFMVNKPEAYEETTTNLPGERVFINRETGDLFTIRRVEE